MAPDVPSGPEGSAAVTDLFSGGGEAGRLMAEHDWASSPVGPVESWPQSMRSAVRLLPR